MPEVVAVIGVGRIGLPICGHLVRAGYRVLAVDVVPERREQAARAGAVDEPSVVTAVGQADVVLTVLPGSPELRSLMLGGGEGSNSNNGSDSSGSNGDGGGSSSDGDGGSSRGDSDSSGDSSSDSDGDGDSDSSSDGDGAGGRQVDSQGQGEDAGGGLLLRLRPGTTWIDLTSTGPELGKQLASAALKVGVHALEAPIGGGVTAAEQARLTFFVGGDPQVLTRMRPLLEVLARPDRILLQGPAGAGYLTKLLVNTLWFGQALATAEVLLLAQAAGLDLARLREVLTSGPAASEFIATVVPSLFEGDYLATFGLDRIVEELTSVQDTARVQGVPLELAGLVTEVHARALDRFGPVDGELMGVAYLEQRAGRTLRAERQKEISSDR